MQTEVSENKNGFLKNFLFGLIIGIASITPGLSGGVLAISFGIYTVAINAVMNIRKNFKQSIIFLTPLGLGAAVGMFIFGIIMKPLLENYETAVIYFFIGMILGSLPSFFKEANKGEFRISYLLPMIVTFCIGILISGAVINKTNTSELNLVTLLISGGVVSVGMIIPGISSSFILLQMGVYNKLITSFLSFDIYVIFWVIIGFILISLLTIKLVNAAFNKFCGFAHYAALGFLLSSVVSVFPGFEWGIGQIINSTLFVIGAIIVYLFMKKAQK